jgi:hypothetical protein
MEKRWLKYFIIGTFVSLYLVVSVISTIHVIQFFDLTNPKWLSISLAIAFELGAAASLASLIALDKMNKFLVWALFITLTAMQAMGNTYYAYTNIQDFQGWSELFGLVEEDIIFQKRILSIISGAILPLVALGFIKSLVDYIKPEKNEVNLDVNIDEDDSYKSDQILEGQVEKLSSENNVDVISISEIKDQENKIEEDPVEFKDTQYVNVNDDSNSNQASNDSILKQASQEIMNANSNRPGASRRIPPFR